MRYVLARIEKNDRDEAYRFFITKSLQLIPQNKWLIKDYNDVVEAYMHPEKIDHRTGDEIVMDVLNSAGLRFED